MPERQTEAPEAAASFEVPAPIEKPVETAPTATATAAMPAPAAAPISSKDPTVGAIEAIMEDGLGETYQHMNPSLRAKFRREGEKVSAKIAEMVRRSKINVRLVLKLITGWLKIIPGVNRFFLEQEAKIKTDRILKL